MNSFKDTIKIKIININVKILLNFIVFYYNFKKRKKTMHEDKVKFDPGFSKFSSHFPQELPQILDEIAGLPQPHQKKFQFQRIEAQAVSMIKTSVYVYLGCVLWGSYLLYRHKDDPREITGNIIKEFDGDIDYVKEIDNALASIEKLDRASMYYLRRPTRIEKHLIGYLKIYREFVLLNNSFLKLETTADIIIPENFRHFAEYSPEKLDELRDGIYKVIETGELEKLAALIK